ncbi:diguanylate cyclase [Sphingomonas sp. ASV193]|uniref:sensor domain-containing diguanylate cyclase n=1 Tax=Sphingomonas sp. ASV193 TaxID=3144405 RepID=UPI0032E8F917
MFRIAAMGRQWPIGLAYFAAASLTLAFTRVTGGVSTLWIATGVLGGILVYRPRRDWPPIVAAAGIASMAATSLFGFGPAGAIPFAFVNMAEATIGARIAGRLEARQWEPFDSLRWVGHLCLSMGLLAPMCVAPFAGLAAYALGQPFAQSALLYFTGHALGNLTVMPLVMVVAHRQSREESLEAIRRHWPKKLGHLLLVAGATVPVFAHDRLSLLFLPILPMVLAAVRCGRETAALSVVLLAAIGGGLTLMGHGPVHLVPGSMLHRMLFYQLYLAVSVLTILPIAADRRARQRLASEAALSEQRFRLIAEQASDIILHVRPDGSILYCSPSMARNSGFDPGNVLGRNALGLVLPDDRDAVAAHHAAILADPATEQKYEFRGLRADGRAVWYESAVRALLAPDGTVEGTISFLRDVDARKAAEATLHRAAFTDPMTGLPNRRAFDEAVGRRLAVAGQGRGDCIALFDLDHFKRVNDVYGHDIGDEALRHVARLSRDHVRESDLFARLGGEEFVMLLPDTDISRALQICDRLRRELALTPLISGQLVVRLTVSGGVAPLGANGLDVALKAADVALYEAKSGGRDQLMLAA